MHAPTTVEETGHPQRWAILGVCALALFLIVTFISALSVALPEIESDLGATAADLQWIVDAYAVVFGGLLLFGGAIGDRIGRRPALIGGLLLFGAGALGGGLGGSVEVLIACRALSGLGAALLLPATLSIITEVFPSHEQPRAIAMWSGVAGGGSAFGPAIGGWLLEVSGWPAVFLLNAGFAAATVVAAVALVPRLPASRSGRLDFPGAALSTIAIGSLLFALIEGPGRGWTSPPVLVAAVLTVAALVTFVRHEGRTPDPMLPLEVLRPRRLRVGAATLTLAAVGFVGVVFVGSQLLQFGWGEAALTAGLLLVPLGLGELATSAWSAKLIARRGATPVVTVGLLLMASGYTVLALTPVGERWLFVLAGLVAGCGNGLVIPISVERIVADAPPRLAGVTAGVNETAIELGASIGIALLGGVQRTLFARDLPEGVPSESFTAALAVAPADTVVDAFVAGARGALVVAAIFALVAIPIARRPH
jgi:EmrB/QacA subfamily drug resistance transporter